MPNSHIDTRRAEGKSLLFELQTESMDREAKEYFWGCELSKENSSYTWSFEEEEDSEVEYLTHTLFIRSAVLGAAAVKGELNIIQVETQTYEDKLIKHALFSLRAGTQECVTADMSFMGNSPATFRLVEGSGPVHICGQHLVEFPALSGDEQYTEDEEIEEEEESPKKKLAQKRKASSHPKAKSKKVKMDVSGDEEDEDEDEEEMDEEVDEEELDEEDDEEEEETPQKNKKKTPKAAGNSKTTKVVRKVKASPKSNTRKPASKKIKK